ncbi:MAG: hypothetical protein QY332_10395 [Anaerolineales bacterium]|nr:MAG: hypothetical protein QY332_10395 [Anaerolineales bacterium]
MSSIQARNVNHPEYQENLNETKYAIIRDAILAILPQSGMSFAELEEKVRAYLIKQDVSMVLFPKPGSVRWYTKAVQLDLEARGIIERVPGQTPICLRRAA